MTDKNKLLKQAVELEKINTLLNKGSITKEEYDYLIQVRAGGKANILDVCSNSEEKDVSLGKKITSFILTLFAMGGILFGTCIFNIYLVESVSDSLAWILIVVWPLFPIILFTIIGIKKKDAGIKWAVALAVLIALIVLFTVFN